MYNQGLEKNLNLVALRIKEVFRYTQEKSDDIVYIDYNNNLSNIQTKCNTAIYGRRGSGKTTLLVTLKLVAHRNKIESTFLDYNLYTDHRYPDLLIANLIKIFEDLRDKVESSKPSLFNFKKSKSKKIILKKLREDIADLKSLKDLPLEFDRDIEEDNTESQKLSGGLSSTANNSLGSINGGVSAERCSSKKRRIG